MSGARLRFIGCGDAFSSGGRFQTCLYLEGAAEPLLIDCGASGLVSLKRGEVDPGAIEYVALSHLHGDHFAGLPFVILDAQFSGRTRPLTIAGPEGTKTRLEHTFDALYPGMATAERAFELRYAQLKDRLPCRLGAALVTPFAVSHPSGAAAYALRIEYGGKLIAFSGDTGWTESLIAAAAGADLFVCECTYFSTEAPNHLDYHTLFAHREELDCRRIVMTHMSDEMLARLDELELDGAADGLAIDL